MREPASRVMPMLSVADMDRSLSFYRDALGGEPRYQFPAEGDPVFLVLRFDTTDLGIGLLSDQPVHGLPQRPASGHRMELCVDVGDTDAAVAALTAIGAAVVLPPTDQPWGERAAYVQDPDGNLVMLVAPLG